MTVSPAYQKMAQYDQWLTYGEDKRPLNPRTGKHAAWKNDPSCHCSYADAVKYMKARPEIHKGLTFHLTDHDPFTCVDTDKVIQLPETPDGTSIIDPMADKIVHVLNSYTEYSRSMTGYHIIVEADEETLVGMPYVDCVEVYSKDRCINMTNKHVEGTPDSIAARPNTTVVTLCEQQDDACSDSDEQSPDGCGGKRTNRDGRDERAEVFPAGKRRVGAFREC